MAIKPPCDKCGHEFSKFGGLFFQRIYPTSGATEIPGESEYKKYHLCVDNGCYPAVRATLTDLQPGRCGFCKSKLKGEESSLVSPPNEKNRATIIYFCCVCERIMAERCTADRK